ncbi:RsmG family class I SAM-dependent methyltransferase [Sorangium sp. So ce136]|uniref:RsmG family class I SAM-dependent methyltransferase n=1 Tax=Sorangium sp. So ce136 TaxID=3133284 RepID=UPI003F526235
MLHCAHDPGLADARLLSEHVPEGRRVVDIGAEAGTPGLPLALLRPDLDVTLVEPLQKRVAFLRTATGTLVQQGVLAKAPRVERARRGPGAGQAVVRGGHLPRDAGAGRVAAPRRRAHAAGAGKPPRGLGPPRARRATGARRLGPRARPPVSMAAHRRGSKGREICDRAPRSPGIE